MAWSSNSAVDWVFPRFIMDFETIEMAQNKLLEQLGIFTGSPLIPEANGIGIGIRSDRPVIVVYLEKEISSEVKSAWRDIDGIPIEFEVIGEITAY
jgi:hypothetical protein